MDIQNGLIENRFMHSLITSPQWETGHCLGSKDQDINAWQAMLATGGIPLNGGIEDGDKSTPFES